MNQLADGGKMVIPVGGSAGQILTLYEREGDIFKKTEIEHLKFVPFVGI
jgi:protein-L-isoaspartate(D-aspartate) O-methyltransferase